MDARTIFCKLMVGVVPTMLAEEVNTPALANGTRK